MTPAFDGGDAMTHRQVDSGFHAELVDGEAFVAGGATIRGQVRIARDASVWFGAVIRGDTECVEIGERSNIQDLSVLHADPGFPCRIGKDVTVGHAAVVHGATVGDGAMIGIRAVVLNGATVGAGAIVGAGAVVTEGCEIPEGHLAVGVPAKVIRQLSNEDIERTKRTAQHYVQAAAKYRETD
jgi:carbonic anhydrase/acetyltransferase-like protein (isoleucine patch superfamily)